MSATTEIILTKDGAVRRQVTDTPITNINEIIAESAATVPMDLPSMFRSPAPHNTRVHMRSTRTRITLFCMLQRLVMSSTWRPYGEGAKKVYPFGSKVNENDFGATYEWFPYGYERYPKKAGDKPTTKEGDMFVYLIITSNKTGLTWGIGDNYLIATRKGDKKLYKLPLHNIYGDGRICMGDGYQLVGGTLDERFNNALKYFESSPWNNHLEVAHEHMQALFSFDLKGNQVPPPEDWHKHCEAVSNDVYSDLPNLIIS